MANYSEKIWKTRKIRINTEARLNKWATIFDILIPLYSLNFIIITILPIAKKDDWISFISITGSLIILVVSIVVANRNHKIRAYKMMLHYIKLDQIYTRIQSANEADKESIYNEYLNELTTIENHNNSDYLKTIIESRNDEGSGFPQVGKVNFLKYYLIKLVSYVIILFLFGLPVLIDLLIIL